ncbi:putative nucleotidyltransferase component of viral defense system [Nocardioides sp. J9]|uniref:nucleotidyl transferase AbiEii/AbiGii toxin family protein n=1 Tax=Nocardioides sp. J9 TaxID=935844 RepID=UPI0011ADAFAB|nr:nucleotidyl transferase AbiEii/AbiGii toxin family protein [Nocardioides sp. J9]TWH00529.1 putative nucleotidyltransferase component of viral defense system [Nocardioides sp. J9]
MSRISRGTTEADAYLDLKNRAEREKRPTQELLQLYVLEAFLSRLAVSDLRDRFVLKGGVLLAAFDERRPTRDVDLAGLNLANDAATVLELVRSIVETSPPLEDGVVFLPETAKSEVIREEDAYSGVRVSMGALLASASLPFHVDVNVGDPIWPAPSTVEVPRLRGGEPIVLAGYPIQMVHAEKIVTAIQRGVANTRWRDFGDIWTLSRRHSVSATDLRAAIDAVAAHRDAQLSPLAEVLDGYVDLGQARWVAWRRRSNSDHLPESFADVLEAVISFADPVLTGAATGSWDTGRFAWS